MKTYLRCSSCEKKTSFPNKTLKDKTSKTISSCGKKRMLRVKKLFDKFPFCVTTSCHQGDALPIGGGVFKAETYITLEVQDEKKFLDVLNELSLSFLKITGIPLNICREYHFSGKELRDSYHWRISFHYSCDTKNAWKEVEETMLKGRRCLERLLQEYHWRHKVGKKN